MKRYDNFEQVLHKINRDMEKEGQLVHTERWQAMDISQMREAQMVELLHYSFQVDLFHWNLPLYQDEIKPNLPWADDHFQERVCGLPINPGTEWKNWPWAGHAEKSLDERGMFNHNYMERYWPKLAKELSVPTETPEEFRGSPQVDFMEGRQRHYGDLDGVVKLLAHEPGTRQAYLPVWFPEDTGVDNTGRKPCTLGYHFIMRNGELDVTYYIRSCDLYRHLRDDIYLTIRLLLWVWDRCQELNPEGWSHVVPGRFIMHITSLHMFVNDYCMEYKRMPK